MKGTVHKKKCFDFKRLFWKKKIGIVNMVRKSYKISSTIIDKPMVNLSIIEQPESVMYGNSITLQAEVEPFLDSSTVTWTRYKKGNKERITHSGKFFIDNSDTRYPKLLIDNLDFNDNGQYVVTVTNARGTGSADIEIKIGGKLFTCTIVVFLLVYVADFVRKVVFTDDWIYSSACMCRLSAN